MRSCLLPPTMALLNGRSPKMLLPNSWQQNGVFHPKTPSEVTVIRLQGLGGKAQPEQAAGTTQQTTLIFLLRDPREKRDLVPSFSLTGAKKHKIKPIIMIKKERTPFCSIHNQAADDSIASSFGDLHERVPLGTGVQGEHMLCSGPARRRAQSPAQVVPSHGSPLSAHQRAL